MKRFRFLVSTSIAIAASFAFALDGYAAGGTFPSINDDNTFSLGQFRIAVAPKFQPFLSSTPDYDYNSVTHRLQSHVLFDPSTSIGRSDPIVANSPADVTGTPVGTSGTIVKDSNFALMPAGFDDPSATLTREVHTKIVDFDLGRGTAGPHVRAGASAPGRPASYGEVEAIDPSGDKAKDFTARSFFDVFVQVDLPGLPSLYNKAPLLIENSMLMGFPPTVVYIHGGSSAVPILFLADDPTGHFKKDDLFGYLVLAGHGIGVDEAAFRKIYDNTPEMRIVPEPSSMLLMVAGLAVTIGFSARRRTRRAV